MADKLQNDTIIIEWRRSVIFILMIFMMASALFLPRAFLSVGMIVFVVICLFHQKINEQFKTFFDSPLLWGMSFLFFIPLITGLWSEDKSEWLKIIRIKLPLVFLPLAFAGFPAFKKKYWERLAIAIILLVTAGTVWSMFQYVPQMQEVHEDYLRSIIIETPIENDHVRFSWLVNVGILSGGWLIFRAGNKTARWFLSITVIWLIVYLHILAARTGLLCLYFSIAILAVWLIFKKIKKIYGIGLIAILISLPLIAYYSLPTFQNRIKYFIYDLPYFKRAHYLEGGNDAMRVISMKAGWNIMNEFPLAGTGFGDIKNQTNKWYAANYPQMKENDKILPGSEWLIYGVGSGWTGFIIFSLIMILPFLVKSIKNKLPWYMLCISTILTFIIDIGLEVQFGVFLYSFVLLWWWKWMSVET